MISERLANWTSGLPGISRYLTFPKFAFRKPDFRKPQRIVIICLIVSIVSALLFLELQTSGIESFVFWAVDRSLGYHLAPGASNKISYPNAGPYDWTLGYAQMPVILLRLKAAGWYIEAQARDSMFYSLLSHAGLYPIYRYKDQAGLKILDRDSNRIYDATQPHHIYRTYGDIPPIVAQTLLFVENRNMLDASHPRRNPAIEWNRLTKAVFDYALHTVNPRQPVIGGSTLATQLEKMRHSPGGRTHSALEKFRQMASATLAAYRDGTATLDAQREIVRNYLNLIPLAASPGYGDVTGLQDGLQVWYGADSNRWNRLLATPETALDLDGQQRQARAYREALSLLLAIRAPDRYLVQDHPALDELTNHYLKGLADRGIISEHLRDLALNEHPELRSRAPDPTPLDFVQNKAQNTIRVSLLPLAGVTNTYDLDRLDLSVSTTIDQRAQRGVTQFLEAIGDPQQAQAAGLAQYQLLEQSNPQNVVYSFTLYERGTGANYLRVETDNLDQPLNINQDTRLELGSTAKLRTLITYLEIVSDLHNRYVNKTPAELNRLQTFPGDHLTEWAAAYLATAKDRSLSAMLQAALDRKYSGSTGESFFTGGGVHTFANFESSENGRIMTIRDAFHLSVNLVFIRLMRDIVNYYRFRVPGATPAVLEDDNDAARRAYLTRFADQEGKVYLTRFYQACKGLTLSQALQKVLDEKPMTATRAAVIFRSVRPQANIAEFTTFLKSNLPASVFAKVDPDVLYAKYGIDKFNLSDRGYLARVHPLELWLLNYLNTHRGARLKTVLANSAQQRQEVYWWLFRTSHKHGQDNRIKTLLEQDAFQQVYKSWKRQGYPFDSIVPSYASTIGVSGDTPAALSELMGILLNDGIRYPEVKIKELRFGQGTPTETVAAKKLSPGVRVISPEIARAVRQELIGVVEKGTARRAFQSVVLSNGQIVPVAGKTGTGDNRLESFTSSGHLIRSKVISRTAAFAFLVGDRFYGTIIAFVPGQSAASYRFTSALAVQIFKDLAPQLKPLMERPRQDKDENHL